MNFKTLYLALRRDGHHPDQAKVIAESRLAEHMRQQLGVTLLSDSLLRDLCLGNSATFVQSDMGKCKAVRVEVLVDDTFNPVDDAKDCGEWTVEHPGRFATEETFHGWGRDGQEMGQFITSNSSGDTCLITLGRDLRLDGWTKHAPKGMSKQVKREWAVDRMHWWKSHIEKILSDDIYNYTVQLVALDGDDNEIDSVAIGGVQIEVFDDESLSHLRDVIYEQAEELAATLKSSSPEFLP